MMRRLARWPNCGPRSSAAILAKPVASALNLTVGDASARLVQDVGRGGSQFRAPAGALGRGTRQFLAGAALLLPRGSARRLGRRRPIFALALLSGWWLAGRGAGAGRDVQRANARLKERYASLMAAAAELRAYGLDGWAADRIAEEGQGAVGRAGAGDCLGWMVRGLAGGKCRCSRAMVALGLSRHDGLPIAAMAALGARHDG